MWSTLMPTALTYISGRDEAYLTFYNVGKKTLKPATSISTVATSIETMPVVSRGAFVQRVSDLRGKFEEMS